MEKTVKVIYGLSEEGQKQSLLQGGDGKKFQTFETPATPKLIKLAKIDKDGNLELTVQALTPKFDIERTREGFDKIIGIYFSSEYNNDYNTEVGGRYYKFELPQNIDTINKFYYDIEKKKVEMEKDIDSLNESNYQEFLKTQKVNLLKKEEELKLIAEQEEKNKKEKEEKENRLKVYEEERKEWIFKFGSDYLKTCLELGQKANKEYVIERANLEFPNYEVDYRGNAKWEEKNSPSVEALKVLKILRNNNLDADIVWLTYPADTSKFYDEDNNYEFEKCEAIVIYSFLNKYNLVRML